METSQPTPKWIIIFLWVTTILTFVLSAVAYIKPALTLGSWPAFGAVGALSLAGPLGLFVARNMAIGAASVFALYNKSINALLTAFVLRAVTDGLDFIHGAIGGNIQLAVLALVIFVIDAVALAKLRKLS